jgi:hypothetical protein
LLRVLATIVLVLAGAYALMAGWTVVQIQLRLARNEPIAARLKAELDREFPGADLHVAASYERDRIWVSAREPLDSETRSRLEQWMKDFRLEEDVRASLVLQAPRRSGGQPEEQEF